MKTKNFSAATAAGLATAALLTGLGCSQVRHVSASRFLTEAKYVGLQGTARETHFSGTADGKAYLRRWEILPLVGERILIFWTPLSELPNDIVEQLRETSANNSRGGHRRGFERGTPEGQR